MLLLALLDAEFFEGHLGQLFRFMHTAPIDTVPAAAGLHGQPSFYAEG